MLVTTILTTVTTSLQKLEKYVKNISPFQNSNVRQKPHIRAGAARH